MRKLFAAAIVGCIACGTALAQSDPLASGRLLIQGSRVTLYADAQTNDADQTINVGERARVRTCYGAVDSGCGAVQPGDPRVTGLVVRAELRGPELPQALALETVPGGTFLLPGLEQEGDYRLENIRLVESATGEVLANAEPSLAVLHVRKILLTSATVRALTLAELEARGITFTSENFQAFSFAVGFAFGNEIVEIELPLAYEGFGTVHPIGPATVDLDSLPANLVHVVERWQPPAITPFKMEVDAETVPNRGTEEEEELTFPMFGAIVLPGNVSYLNQFFEAKVVVANGAGLGAPARLEEITGTLRLPPNNVLRVNATEPAVGFGQAVPVVRTDGGRELAPTEQGAAAWTLEGLVAGTHSVAIEVQGKLVRPGREPLWLLSRLQAAIEVVDARFNLTFSHPDIVREGEAYSLFVTVTNLSRAPQQLVTVDLDEAHITGAHRENPDDPLRFTIPSLAPGQAETLEYRLVAELDGMVRATTFESSSATGQGTIRLYTGVGELGIVLSPATLVLPRFSDRLKRPFLPDDELFRAHNRFLGLSYSLAVASAALTPPDLPRVIRTDVERRAIDFAQAGMRTYLHDGLLESLEVLQLDYLGNRSPLAELDELRRRTNKGLAVGSELARAMRAAQATRGLAAEELFDQFVATTTYTAPYLGAMLVADPGSDDLTLEVRAGVDGTAGAVGLLSGVAGAPETARTVSFGEMLAVLRQPTDVATVPFALVGHLALDDVHWVVVRNHGATLAGGRLLVVVPEADGTQDRRLEVAHLDLPPGGAALLAVGAGVASPQLVDAAGLPFGVAVASSRVDRPPFRLLGVVQDFRLNEKGPDLLGNMTRPNRYGNGVHYLFNRPPSALAARQGGRYRFRSTFSGLDTAGQPASGVSEKQASGVWIQDDERVVSVRLETPLSALIDPATQQPLLTHENLIDSAGLVDPWGESLDANVPPPTVETVPPHGGGLVSGRVVRGTGEPASGVTVQLLRPRVVQSLGDDKVLTDYLGEVVTGADGRFFFDFVEIPSWDRQVLGTFSLRAIVPAGSDPEAEPATTQEVSATIRLQNRMTRIDVALLGRGTIDGRVVYADDESPVPAASIYATSTLFSDQRRATADAQGGFRVGGVPVGPITVTARDQDGRVAYATVGVEQPGDRVTVLLRMPRRIPGLGTVTGTVVLASSGAAVGDALVAVYSAAALIGTQHTDALGRFRFERVPEGQVSLQAANWTVSRVAVFTDLMLSAGETREVELRLPVSTMRSVTGEVLFHDPVANTNTPMQGVTAFIEALGIVSHTDSSGRYRLEGVPVNPGSDVWSVRVVDTVRQLAGSVRLPPILDTSPDEIQAQPVVLEKMTGGIDGVVLDTLGRPIAGADVVSFPHGPVRTGANGEFSFPNLPLGDYGIAAHLGDGLQAGRIGFFGTASTRIAYGGHRPFVTVRFVGGGQVTVRTTTANATGVLTPIYYRPTYYSDIEWQVRLRGAYLETTTDPNGNLELQLPVGRYEIVAFNPFHGTQTISGNIEYAGQAVHHEIVFEETATVTGQVVGVDGVTPVPGAVVVMEAGSFNGQTQTTDAEGRFRYELVPKGRVTVSASGLAGGVERVGRTLGFVGTAGQTLDLVVQMKAQGTVTGQALERFNGVLRPLAHAYFQVQENSYPFRRLPEDGSWLVTDAEGRYRVSHLYAGGLTVTVRDSGQLSRMGTVRGDLLFDWQVVPMPDVVMATDIGSLQVAVRHPVTGGPVANAIVRLSNGDATVTDADGLALFDALPIGSYSVYAFYAPTGQSGRLSAVSLVSAGQRVTRTVYLDQRGEVLGTLWDDAAMTTPVSAAVVELTGWTAGGRVRALAMTDGTAQSLGRFSFTGIPEGSFQVVAVAPTSPRRASATAALTATAPSVTLNLVLEPVGDLYFELLTSLRSGLAVVDPSTSLFATRLNQGCSLGACLYDYTQMAPEPGTSRFKFPNVLVARSGGFAATELVGERREGFAGFATSVAVPPPGVTGTGTVGSPYQVVLTPRGVVRVWVRDPAGQPVPGANVTLSASSTQYPSVTGADGSVSFSAVPAGPLRVAASSLLTGTSGYASATLTYDDDVIELYVALAPAVVAEGIVYQPVPGDLWNGDPGLLVPAPGILVEIRDAAQHGQLVLTDDRGRYRFVGLAVGGYWVRAQSSNGDQLASVSGTLVGPDGHENVLPSLLLDASPPRIVTLVPPSGMEGVSRTAPVEIVFSEPLLSAVLPVHQPNPMSYFSLVSAAGRAASGTWTSWLDPASGQQVVRFTPSAPYDNSTTYSLTIAGGSGGVRDRIGRPLSATGHIGSSFRTSDTVGPAVIGTVPTLLRPVDPHAAVRFDFNESVHATDEQLDGDLVGDALELYWQFDGGGGVEWRRLPVLTYLTRSNYSLALQFVEGINLSGDTLQRRVVLTGLLDGNGNGMPRYEATFRIYDGHAPAVDALPLPSGAPTGELLQSNRYTLTPVLSQLDDVTVARPGGDIDRVEYYYEDPDTPNRVVSPFYAATTSPFSYTFTASYVGDGSTPRPFPIWVRAFDTSTNRSNVAQAAMVVLPNTLPGVESVGLSATAPVPGVPYAGSALVVTIGGFSDLDSSQLTLFAELWQEGGAVPLSSTNGLLVVRAPGGWNDTQERVVQFTLPTTIAEGTRFFARARVLDPSGGVGTRESATAAVADDLAGPTIDDFSVRLAGGPVTQLFIGEEFYFEMTARDVETSIGSIALSVDRSDLFPGVLQMTRVTGTSDLYRSATLVVPAGLAANVPIRATVAVADRGNNESVRNADFAIGPERDLAAPAARWHQPWPGALWPADYVSTVSAAGAALELRFYARDTSLDPDGNPVPGRLATIEVRGPVRNAATGAIELAAAWSPASKVPGSEDLAGAIYHALWRVPNGIAAGTEIPFETRLVDAGNTETIRRVTMTAVPPRQVYEAVNTAVGVADPMWRDGWNAAGPVFLLDGSTLSVPPQTDGTVRRLPALFLYTGASTDSGSVVERSTVLTAPEITSYQSAILFHPLELEVELEVGVAVGSRIDMTRKGLLGSSTVAAMVLPGEVGAQPLAGGSHGGEGWFGSPSGGWERTVLNQPGSVFDSLRDPRLPGGGGASNSNSLAGGAGGGVIRLMAPLARVRIDGEVVADGESAGTGGGGAGGAIRLAAARLEGAGRILARGGNGSYYNSTGGGGGGRISLSVRDLAASFELATHLDASGGHNHSPSLAAANRRAGAGTIFLEPVDPVSGLPLAGRLLVAGPVVPTIAALTPLPALGDGSVVSIDPATASVVLGVATVRGSLSGDSVVLSASSGGALGNFTIVGQRRVESAAVAGGWAVELTVAASPIELAAAAAELAASRPVAFHGESRLRDVVVDGAARLVAADDLSLGPDESQVRNDRAQIELRHGARVALRGEGPVVTFTTNPPNGSDLLLGNAATVSWTVADPLGIVETRTSSTQSPTPQVQSFFDERTTVASAAPTTLSAPITGAPPSLSYTVEARDRAGRSVSAIASWNVLPNAAPSALIGLAPGTGSPVRAGYPFVAVVDAADRERLARITLNAAGPVSPASQVATVAGSAASSSFTLNVSPTADGSQPIVLQAVVEDASGASMTTNAYTVPVAANGSPVGSLSIAVGAPTRLEPGRSTTLAVHAEDSDGLVRVDLAVAGSVTQPTQTKSVTGTSVDTTFAITAATDATPQILVVTATLTDQFGVTATTAALSIPLVSDIDPPTVTLSVAPDRGANGVYRSGEVVTWTATASDDVSLATLSLEIGGVVASSTSSPLVHEWTVPVVESPTTITATTTATDPGGNSASVGRTLSVEPALPDGPPTVRVDCPTTGALLPADYQMTLAVTASDSGGVAAVRFFEGASTTPFAEVTPATGTPSELPATATFDLATATGIWPMASFRIEAVDNAGQVGTATLEIERASDVVDLHPDGQGMNDWSGLGDAVVALRSGTLTLLPWINYVGTPGGGSAAAGTPILVRSLLVLPGATITHPATASASSPGMVEITASDRVYVACGGAIDVSARGYAPLVSYPGVVTPGSSGGGSHLGEGGPQGVNPVGETYGSLVSPQDNGGGAYYDGRGGGAVRIVAAGRVQIDGAIRANGQSASRGGGAGGSVWLTAGELSGAGSIEANGGNETSYPANGSGGGGAISLEYTMLSAGSTLLDHLKAQGGSTGVTGGAGTVMVKSGGGTYGDLTIDNGTVSGNRRTSLPSLGSGVAQDGSGSQMLVTDRLSAIPEYFVGHWVEIRSGATGELEGIWRIGWIEWDGLTVGLEPNGGEPVTVDPGDTWQGVYRFDRYTVRGQVQVVSADAIQADRMVVASGATLTQPYATSSSGSSCLSIEVGELVVESGGAIDVSSRGYAPRVSYPGVGSPGGGGGGSHLGEGGPYAANPVGETYGSVVRPQENGSGAYYASRGGGAVRIVATGRVQIDGAIRANGQSTTEGGGAGGSVWLRAGELSGAGSIEANGGNVTYYPANGSGGGGAISVEYSTLSAGSSLLEHLTARGGSTGVMGGAGTMVVKGGSGMYGDLTIDNGTVPGNRRTVLPSLGSGTALSGSGGATLVTGRSAAIRPYFIGHWVEIRSGSTGVLEGTWRIASIGVDGTTVTLASNGGEPVTVNVGDRWQGVYRFDRYTVRGSVQVVSADPIRVFTEQVITGTVEVDAIQADRLVIRSGATLTQHYTASSATPSSLTIEVGELVVESGGAIDVSSRGYAPRVSYPGVVTPGDYSGGSHMGEGGVHNGPSGETYGSPTRPQANGGGAYTVARGGGAVQIVATGRVQIDGAIRANGQSATEGGGAGGSVWLRARELSGVGSIEAKGGNVTYYPANGSGGGGAISVEYTTLSAESTLLEHLTARGGSTGVMGGAGTMVVKGGSGTYGDLTIDNATVPGNRRTVLPSLGSGTAQSGSGGATLVTGLSASIRPYFIGHWVEVRSGSTGVLEGTWRVASIGVDGKTVTLASNGGEQVTVDVGDAWQGVYRFDRYTVRGEVQVVSADPIRVTTEQVIAGSATTDNVSAGRLVVRSGGVLTQSYAASSSRTSSLTIEVGELVVESGGAIDVSSKGYAPQVSYPGVVASGDSSGGSHVGEGGPYNVPLGETYGSVTRPQENGGGAYYAARGGGAVRIEATGRVQVDGAIRANGQAGSSGAGAGGSVWVRAQELSGVGLIEASGGSVTNTSGSGGGGAISVEYATLSAGSTVLDHLKAQGGSVGKTGGAGTVVVKGESGVFGDLTIDNGTVSGNKRTVLPSLGRGVAQSGSGGATLVTGRSTAIPLYFVGHWVEVRSGSTGVLSGTWRIASIGVDGTTVTLASNGGEPVTVGAGDGWQGVYRFDRYTVRGEVQVVSADPIRVTLEQVVAGNATTESVSAGRLVVRTGGVLTQPYTASSSLPSSLTIEVGELVVESGGAIDVSSRGYAPRVSYPGVVASGDSSGGSHVGEGGLYNLPLGQTYGSVVRPQENGGGSYTAARGGGAARIVATGRAQIDGAIRANGQTGSSGAGAGGSVWLRAQELVGVGVIETSGGSVTNSSGAGGGGAISVEYTTLSPGSTVLDHLKAQGGTTGAAGRPGGAGTVYVMGPTSTLGRLTVDNGLIVTSRRTVLPALGRGVLQSGSHDAVVLTGRDSEVPAYFVGAWFEVEGQDRIVKGVWRIAAVAGTTVTLEPKPGMPFTIAAGDRWRGVYRFDEVVVTPGALLVSTDPIIQLVPPLPLESLDARELTELTELADLTGLLETQGYDGLYGNDDAPAWHPAEVELAVGEVAGSYRVTLRPGSVTDAQEISEVSLTSGSRSVAAEWTAGGATLYWSGVPGQRLYLVATDAHARYRRSEWLELPPLPTASGWSQLTLPPATTPTATAGGSDWSAAGDEGVTVWATGPQPLFEVGPGSALEHVEKLALAGPYLASATSHRIDLIDRVARTVVELSTGEATVVDLVGGESAFAVLLLEGSESQAPRLRLAEIAVGTEATPHWLPLGEATIDPLSDAVLLRAGGGLHVFGHRDDGSATVASWPSTVPGEAALATPESQSLAIAWRALGGVAPSSGGAALLIQATAVQALELQGSSWQATAHVELGAEVTSAALVDGTLVATAPGELLVSRDFTSSATPTVERVAGSAYTAVAPLPGGEVLLWSPRVGVPPLRLGLVALAPGGGFQTVWNGLP